MKIFDLNGNCINIWNANFQTTTETGATHYYDNRKKETWLATVLPSGVVVLGNSSASITKAGDVSIKQLLASIREPQLRNTISTYDLADLKRELENFNAKTKSWK